MTSITPSRFLRRLSALVVVTLAGCQTETIVEQAPPSGLQVLTLSQLPPAVREQALSVGSALQKQALFFRNERSFGTVANGRIHRVERPDGRVSYTLPMQRLGTGLYYDNLVIQQLPDGTTSETLIRYEPQREWWQKSQGVYNYAAYSGRVSFFTATGEPIASVALQEGRIAPSPADKTATAQRTQVSCYITDIQYAGLEQDGVFYVTDIMYWFECEISSDGNTDPDGGSYDPGGGGTGVGSAPTGEPEYAEDGGAAGNGDAPGGEEEVVVDGPDHAITNVSEFLNCFDINQSATLTIYAVEPNPGSGATSVGTSVGHAYVGVSQGNNTSIFGYYPVSNWINPYNTTGSSILGNDGGSAFSASIATTISGNQLQQIINASINFNPTYNLNTYNCTDFAIEIGNLGGLNLPPCNGTWLNGGGSNPGTLGLEIRNRVQQQGQTTSTNGGNSPATHKGC